jgi:putative intracellular protease/amidase
MKRSSNPESASSGRAAFFWDESFLWGLMSFKALCAGRLSFDLVRSDDIRKGVLRDYAMLFVPGGWASNKMKSLDDEGTAEIRRFVREGGSYLGFCGGAGLATLDGMGLLNVKRKPTKERVPSFSGRIRLSCAEHEIWKGATGYSFPVPTAPTASPVFHAWWPSQFVVDGEELKILATYGEALPDSFSSDLNVGDTSANGNWAELERLYGINLDPGRLLGDPAVVEGRCGKGRVILSLIHFDTPEDPEGQVVLRNLWKYLGGAAAHQDASNSGEEEPAGSTGKELIETVAGLEARVEELILLGMRNFLWFWRNPMLLQWRRGVRGLEYCTLHVLIKEIAVMVRALAAAGDTGKRLNRIGALLGVFVDEAVRLLVMERLAMQNGHITYERCDDPEIKEIRTKLFSNSKSHGGLFKELLDEIDAVLFSLLSQKVA